jgi:hypothetical protein
VSSTARQRLTLAILALLATGFGVSRCSPPPPPAFPINPNQIAENEILSMAEQVQLYRETRAALPHSLLDLTRANLIKNAQDDGSVLDPWKRPYEYRLDPTSKYGFVVLSRGANLAVDDDDLRSDRIGKK